MTELIDWLNAQLDEDERMLERLTASFMHGFETNDEEPWGHFTDERRLRADLEAKRRILDEIVDEANSLDHSVDQDRRVGIRDDTVEPYLGDLLLKVLASAYRHRSGYQEAWRP